MKIISKLFITAIIIMMTVGTAMAAEFHIGDKTDMKNGTIDINGKLDGLQNNRVVTLIFGETDYEKFSDDTSKIYFMDSVAADYDGSFNFTFNYGNPGKYMIEVVADGFDESKEYTIFEWDKIMSVLTEIKNGSVPEDTLYSYLSEYFDVFAVILPNQPDKILNDLIAKRVYEGREKIDLLNQGENALSSTRTLINNAINEYKLLKEIQNAANWTQIGEILPKLSSLTGVELTDFGTAKQKICSGLIGNLYKNAESVKDEITKIKNSANQSTGGAGGSGSVGGGNRGGTIIGSDNQNSEITMVFDDLTNVDWAKDAIIYLAKKGIINGVSENKFEPHGLITREQIVKILVGSFDIQGTNQNCPFKDVIREEWYGKYIFSAYSEGIINGISEDYFGVGENLTRQDMAVIIYRCALKKGIVFDNDIKNFNDDDEIADYAKEAVGKLAGAGIINGMDDNSFSPNEKAQRAQAALIIYNILKMSA